MSVASPTGTMRALVGDDLVEEGVPEPWTEHVLREAAGRPVQFGLTPVRRLRFDAGADHNRDHVLVRVTAFALDDGCLPQLFGASAAAIDGTRGLGHDFVGQVLSVGNAVRSVSVGDRVIPCHLWPPPLDGVVEDGLVTTSASRELLRVRAADLVVVPGPVPDAVAAVLPTVGSEVFAVLRRAAVRPTERVLVCGTARSPSVDIVPLLVGAGADVTVLTSSVTHATALRPIAGVGVFGIADGGALARQAAAVGGFDLALDFAPDQHAVLATGVMGLGSRYLTTHSALPRTGSGFTATWGRATANLAARDASVLLSRRRTRRDLEDAVAGCLAGWSPQLDATFGPGRLREFLDRCFDRWEPLGQVVFEFGQGT